MLLGTINNFKKEGIKMKIKFNLDCIKPMVDWLLDSKNNGIRDKKDYEKF